MSYLLFLKKKSGKILKLSSAANCRWRLWVNILGGYICQHHWLLYIVSLFFEQPKGELLYDFLSTVKAAPHECVIRTGQP